MRSMTLCCVFGSISTLLASSRCNTLRANSMTMHCMPKQMPRVGFLCSRHQRSATNLPSVPRWPNPGATRMASCGESNSSTLPSFTFSLLM